MSIFKRSIYTWFVILISVQANGQETADRLRDITGNPTLKTYGLQYAKEVKEYYILTNYQFSWLTNTGHSNITILSDYISNAAQSGLEPGDYQPALFQALAGKGIYPANPEDSLLAELKITDAAIHFIHDLLMGNNPEPLGYNGIKIPDTCFNVPALLNSYLVHNRFPVMVRELEFKQKEFVSVKDLLNRFQQVTAETDFKDAVIISSDAGNENKPLFTRLYQLGLIQSDTVILKDADLKEKIKKAQDMFGLPQDGILKSRTLGAFNVPFSARISELAFTLNTLRWLHCIKQNQHIIVVNIPSASLLVYEHGKIVLESRIIAGKRSTPTPTLSSTITEVILYPYWNVPYKIATRELLPAIKRNPAYLDANNYQVLNLEGKVTDPKKVNWLALSTKYFPYVIRQSTGCDNALGLIKLNFFNPFTVYLHDTPGKNLFRSNSRFFSHGCMRVENAMETGRYVLQGNSIAIDTLTEKGCINNQSPITVTATENIPVFVLYHTAWMDSESTIRFYEDVYNRIPKLRK